MASPIELAVVELQIVVRQVTRRLTAIEHRLGLHPDDYAAKPSRGGPYTPLASEKLAVVTRTAEHTNAPYEIAAPRASTPVAPEPPGAATPPPPPDVPSAPPAVPSTPPPSPEPPPSTLSASENAPPTPAPGVSPSSDHTLQPHDQSDSSPGDLPDLLPPQPPPEPEPPGKKVIDFLRTYNPPPRPQYHIERTLGLDVATWLAAFAIMGAILFFLKWGGDDVAFFRPAVRVTLALIAGAAMIAIGLVLHWRKLATISAALFGGGLAVLMSALFAVNVGALAPVPGQSLTLPAIALVALLGLGLGLLTRSIALPVLAFAGMYLAPIILSSTVDNSLPLLRYLFIITACALALAQLKRTWDFLRLVAFAAAWAWLLAWTVGEQAAIHAHLGIVAVASFYLLFLLMLALNLKLALAKDPAQVPPQTTTLARFWDAISAIFSLLNTGAAVLAFSLLYQPQHQSGLWIPFVAMGVAMGLLALALRTQFFSLAASIQSVALFLAAIPLYLEAGEITLGYSFIALAFGLYARATNSQFFRFWTFASLLLMTTHFFAFDSFDPLLQETLFSIAGIALSTWMLLGWTAGLLALILAWLSRPTTRRLPEGTTEFLGAPWATVAGIALSTLIVFVVNFQALDTGTPFTTAAVLWTLALLAVVRSGALADISSAIENLIAVLLMLLSAKWFLFEGVSREAMAPAPENCSAWPLLNLFSANGLLLAAAVFLLNPLRDTPATGRRLVAWWITTLAFILLNVQTLRAVEYVIDGNSATLLGDPQFIKSVSLTALWAAFAAGMVAIGFLRQAPAVRYVALALLAVAILKIVFVDMATAATPLRILAFMILGILLFVVSFLYHRHVSQLPAPVTNPPDPPNWL